MKVLKANIDVMLKDEIVQAGVDLGLLIYYGLITFLLLEIQKLKCIYIEDSKKEIKQELENRLWLFPKKILETTWIKR